MRYPLQILSCSREILGAELANIALKQPLFVVSDSNTRAAYGFLDTVTFPHAGHFCYATPPHADMATAYALAEQMRGYASALAIGSGTINR